MHVSDGSGAVLPALPMEEIDAVDWVRSLVPSSMEAQGPAWSITPVTDHSVFERVSRFAGEAPSQWAVQVGDRIAHFQHRRYPRWATSDLEHRSNRIGPEAMALVSLDFLASGRFSPGVITAAVETMMSERHVHSAPLNMLLQSSADVYARLAQEYFYACSLLVDVDHQLDAAQTVTWALLTCVREYTEAIVSTHTAHSKSRPLDNVLLRNTMVEELLRGAEGNLIEAENRLGYRIANRQHRSFVGWVNPDDTEALDQLHLYFSQLAYQVGGSTTLLTPRPAMGEMWLWAAVTPDGFGVAPDYPRVPEGVRVVTATAGEGLAGFQLSHVRATEVRRASSSFRFPPHRITEYSDVAAVLQFAGSEVRAAEFAVEELGQLASCEAGYDLERNTLATQLRTQSISDTARELFVARSTVAYRLRKAASLIPPGWERRPLEIALALRLVELLAPEHIMAALEGSCIEPSAHRSIRVA